MSIAEWFRQLPYFVKRRAKQQALYSMCRNKVFDTPEPRKDLLGTYEEPINFGREMREYDELFYWHR